MPSLSLRPYQAATVERVRAAFASGKRAVLVVAPTGSGKTAVAVHIIDGVVRKKRRAVFVANRRVLVEQTSAKLDEFGLHDHGVVMAGHYRRRPQSPVQVASIQTLTRREHYPAGDLIVCDEAHASTGRSYRTLKERYPRAYFLGLTATPFRTDGSGLDVFFDSIVVTATIADLIEQGYLVRPRVYAPCGPDLTAVKIVGGEYDERGLEKAMNTKELVGNIIDHWKRLAAGKKTACFASSVAHSHSLVDRFTQAGVAAEHLDANTPGSARAKVFADFKDGELLVVSSVGVISEGWDAPWCEAGIMARPTQSLSLHIQQQGRILRPWVGKAEALILDHAGNTARHGLVTDELEYSLDGKDPKDRAASARAKARVCPACGTAMPMSATHCICGKALFTVPGEADGLLFEIKGVVVRDLPPFTARLAYWDWLEEQRAERGYKEGWSVYRFKEHFGVLPQVVAGNLVDPTNLTTTEQYQLWDEIEAMRVNKGFSPGWSYYRYMLRAAGNQPPRGVRSRPPLVVTGGGSA